MTVDVSKFTPHGKWCVVKADPRMETTKGGIHLPKMQTAAERVMEGTGTLLKIGADTEAILDYTGGIELTPGMRIFFRGFLKDAFAEFATEEDGLAIFLLRVEDIMGIIDDGDLKMGAYT